MPFGFAHLKDGIDLNQLIAMLNAIRTLLARRRDLREDMLARLLLLHPIRVYSLHNFAAEFVIILIADLLPGGKVVPLFFMTKVELLCSKGAQGLTLLRL